ncbi:hypothetical protein V8G54_029940, partial [Vigna mungo]
MQVVQRRSIWRRQGCRGRDQRRRCNACASTLARRNWVWPRASAARWRLVHCTGTAAATGKPRTRRSSPGSRRGDAQRRRRRLAKRRRSLGRVEGRGRRRICGRRGCARPRCSGGR